MTRCVDDGFGDVLLYRRCATCRAWKAQHLGNFKPRRRNPDTRRVLGWQSYCRPCSAARERAAPPTAARAAQGRERWQAMKADPAALAVERARHAQAYRLRSERDPERVAEARRRYREGVRLDPVRYAAYLETNRMAARLRRERAGVILPVAEGLPGGPALPSAPLVAFIDQRVKRARGARLVTPADDTLSGVCAKLGIDERQHRAWSTGEYLSVRFDVADRVITRGGALWFDVYDPELHPEAERAFAG